MLRRLIWLYVSNPFHMTPAPQPPLFNIIEDVTLHTKIEKKSACHVGKVFQLLYLLLRLEHLHMEDSSRQQLISSLSAREPLAGIQWRCL